MLFKGRKFKIRMTEKAAQLLSESYINDVSKYRRTGNGEIGC